MENDDTKKSKPETSSNLPPGTPETQATKKQRKASDSADKSKDNKKWSLCRHWKSASRAKQVKWIFEGIGGFIALAVLCNYIWSNLQTVWNFRADQRPRISVLGYKIGDTVTEKYELNEGHPFFGEITFQNTGKSTAYHVYIHRHVVTGKNYPSQIKIEPSDVGKTDYRLDPGAPAQVTDAVSVEDTYRVESLYVDPHWFKNWDGITPIVVFGRFVFEDSFGTKYCTPFGATYLNSQTFSVLSSFPPSRISVSELCPAGTPE
jgi:hypothetical protein